MKLKNRNININDFLSQTFFTAIFHFQIFPTFFEVLKVKFVIIILLLFGKCSKYHLSKLGPIIYHPKLMCIAFENFNKIGFNCKVYIARLISRKSA